MDTPKIRVVTVLSMKYSWKILCHRLIADQIKLHAESMVHRLHSSTLAMYTLAEATAAWNFLSSSFPNEA